MPDTALLLMDFQNDIVSPAEGDRRGAGRHLGPMFGRVVKSADYLAELGRA